MNTVSTIAKKRNGGELTHAEIAHLVAGHVAHDIPDYQMSAWAMAVYFRGMTPAETVSLTDCMLASGARLAWDKGSLPVVDKHSTGGIGDKVSLLLAPMLACCNLQVPMISGRGLGATGGTLDKLESIPGFRTNLSLAEIQDIVKTVGCVITGTTPDLVPADQKLYALRDVTATVPSIPLITASIMSKKLAEGLDALVLDVKFGSGAFMKTAESARELAQSLVDTGSRMGLPTTARLTDMNQPLGHMVGNTVEVNEAIAALEGQGPADLMDVTLALGADLLVSTNRVKTSDIARKQLQQTINTGAAKEKFAQMITAQGGNLDAQRPLAPSSDVLATHPGYVAQIDAELLGQAIIAMRGGRQQLGDQLDHATGFEIKAKLGDRVEINQPLARVFAKNNTFKSVQPKLTTAIQIADKPPKLGPLVLEPIK